MSENEPIVDEHVLEDAHYDEVFKGSQPSAVPVYTESDKEDKKDEPTFTQWAIGGNGRFTPVGASVPKLGAGIYEAYATPGSWGLERLEVSSDEIYELPDMATNEVLDEAEKFWNNEARYRKHNLLYKRGIILYGPPGCLTADTFIPFTSTNANGTRRNHKGGSIKRLYELFNKASVKGKGKYLRNTEGVTYRIPSMDDEGRLGLNTVKNVICSGVKACYSLTTTTGRTIHASADHEFFNGIGYTKIKDLHVGDTVYVTNNMVTRINVHKSIGVRQYVYVKHHPIAGIKKVNNKYAYHRLATARAVVEAAMNGLTFKEYVNRLNTGNLTDLQFLARTENVHHKDENMANDTISNLEIVNQQDHSKLHGMLMPLKGITNEEVIANIEPIGNEETYDIVMDDPYRNFVANGFVVHNSGKTVTIKLLMKGLIDKGGIILIVQNVPLSTMALKAIKRIETNRNIICIFEDIDEILHTNGESSVLSMLDGEHNVDRVMNIASTNYADRLGARIINRPSRFDRRVYVGMPGPDARMHYLKRATDNSLSDADLQLWTKDTAEMSIAHLRELVAACFCLDQPYKEVIERLSDMAKKVKADEEFKSRGKFGFEGAKLSSSSW